MSTFDVNSKEYKEQVRAQQMRDEAQAIIETETKFFHSRVSKTVESQGYSMTPVMDAYGMALTREVLTILRGQSMRVEQLGEHVMRLGATAKQSWVATQVTIDAVAKQSSRTHAASQNLKNAMATRKVDSFKDVESAFRYLASQLDPNGFGWRDVKSVNDAFESSARALTRQAREDAQSGDADTAETQGEKVLQYITQEHAEDIANLPGVQDAMHLRAVEDIVDAEDL